MGPRGRVQWRFSAREHWILGMPVEDSSRQRQLRDWLVQHVGQLPPGGLVPASADASFRRYYRLTLPADGPLRSARPHGKALWPAHEVPGSVILMDAPPPQEDLGRFVAMAQHLASLGLHVPTIYLADLAAGIALVGDLGASTYLASVAEVPTRREPLYEAAIDALVTLQRAPAEMVDRLPPYDEALLRRELGLFDTWYLQRHLRISAGTHDALLAPANERLVAYALARPTVAVHRDYHSRNLMCAPPLPGILDFQDMVRGAPAYDLASLLRDCYLELPVALQGRCLQRYREGLGECSRGLVGSFAALQEDVDWAAIQRHLKVLGIFTRLWYRDGRSDYLQYLPRVRAYLVDACDRHGPLRALGELIEELGPMDDEAVVREAAGRAPP